MAIMKRKEEFDKLIHILQVQTQYVEGWVNQKVEVSEKDRHIITIKFEIQDTQEAFSRIIEPNS